MTKQKRITVRDLKAKNFDYKKLNDIINYWNETCVKDRERLYKGFDELFPVLGVALFSNKEDYSVRIGLLVSQMDKLALTIFTPAAWKLIKTMITEEVEKKYEVEVIPKGA